MNSAGSVVADPALARTADARVEDLLLRRDVKARMFGEHPSVMLGRYEILTEIGRGGMGTVYAARDPELDRKVAVKVLHADQAQGRDRLGREARALAKLAHPNVVGIHMVGTHAGQLYIAMEHVPGRSLRHRLDESPSWEALLDAFAQAGDGLAAAHAAGVVHRDFKPDNVLVGDDGRVRVVDFGVAKQAEEDDPAAGDGDASPSDPLLTRTGQLLGTPAYMAPEQLLGRPVDAKADVYAFCAALYEALCGQRPFAGGDFETLSRSILGGQQRKAPPNSVPPKLQPLIGAGLSVDPSQRPRLETLVAAIRSVLRRPAGQRNYGWIIAGLYACFLVMALLFNTSITVTGASLSLFGPDPDDSVEDGGASSLSDADRQAVLSLGQAESLYRRGGEAQLHEAISHLTRIPPDSPQHLQALALLAKIQIDLEDYDAATKTTLKCIYSASQANADLPADCWLLLGVLRERQKRTPEAIEALERYLEQAPSGAYAADALKRIDAMQRAVEAGREYGQLIASARASKVEAARALFGRGGDRRAQEALGLLQGARADAPLDESALVLLAQVLFSLDALHEARAASQACIELAPDYPDCWETHALVADRMGDYSTSAAAKAKYVQLAMAPEAAP